MCLANSTKEKLFWTDRITKKAKNDFLFVVKHVFGLETVGSYETKFDSNIYGPSIIVVSYCNKEPVGVRALWRNDLDGRKAFQPGSTAVLKEHRGKGLFRKMTELALKELGESAIIYNFPNDNSLPGYLKMGWRFCERKQYRIISPLINANVAVDDMDDEYLDWLLSGRELSDSRINFCRFKGRTYLLKRRMRGLHVAMARVNGSKVKSRQRLILPFFLEYSKTGYLGRGIVTVAYNAPSGIKIPIYKADTLF